MPGGRSVIGLIFIGTGLTGIECVALLGASGRNHGNIVGAALNERVRNILRAGFFVCSVAIGCNHAVIMTGCRCSVLDCLIAAERAGILDISLFRAGGSDYCCSVGAARGCGV